MAANSISRITSKGAVYDLADLQARIKLDTVEEELSNINQKSANSDSRLSQLIKELGKGKYANIPAKNNKGEDDNPITIYFKDEGDLYG